MVSNTRNLIRELDHLIELYGTRNRVFIRSLAERVIYLQSAVKDLYDAVRQDRMYKTKEVMFARVVCRLWGVFDYFDTPRYRFPFVETLSRKYPLTGCSYCLSSPCTCSFSKRDHYQLSKETDKIQETWGMLQWQQHFHELYGKANEGKDYDYLYSRLVQETIELATVMNKPYGLGQEVLLLEYAKECADIFAWLCAFATQQDVIISHAYMMSFSAMCPNCSWKPCRCEGFHAEPVDLDLVEQNIRQNGFSAQTHDFRGKSPLD